MDEIPHAQEQGSAQVGDGHPTKVASPLLVANGCHLCRHANYPRSHKCLEIARRKKLVNTSPRALVVRTRVRKASVPSVRIKTSVYVRADAMSDWRWIESRVCPQSVHDRWALSCAGEDTSNGFGYTDVVRNGSENHYMSVVLRNVGNASKDLFADLACACLFHHVYWLSDVPQKVVQVSLPYAKTRLS